MQGKNSKLEFFRNLPNLIYKTYQCSILSTPDAIEKAFKSAKQASLNNMKNQDTEG